MDKDYRLFCLLKKKASVNNHYSNGYMKKSKYQPLYLLINDVGSWLGCNGRGGYDNNYDNDMNKNYVSVNLPLGWGGWQGCCEDSKDNDNGNNDH